MMIDGRLGPASSRRAFMKGAAGLLAISVLPSGLVVGKAWSQMPRSTKPETFATLVQMSRDTYPHDLIEDEYYAKAVETLDEGARSSEEELALLEDGVSRLNEAAGETNYLALESEEARVAILKGMEADPFFQKVRSNLVVGLYNQKELWPRFGYEGASADLGGYLDRGFDDIDWV